MSARWRRRGGWLTGVALVWSLLAACSAARVTNGPTPGPTPSEAVVARDYWPTAGWRTAAPEDQGVDPAALSQIKGQVAAAYPQVRSVLVVRHGRLVYEKYWHGLSQASGHDVRSVTKSVVGTLVGIAIAEGKIRGLESTVGELLAARLPSDADPRTAGITIRQLLTMTSGLAGDDDDGDPRITDELLRSPDWVRHILGRRLEADPGTRFAYSNASSHLLSAIVATTTGQSTLAYARAKLFGPLGIRTEHAFEPVLRKTIDEGTLRAYDKASVAWPVDPQGYHFGAAFLRLPARDLAKLGYLYLNGGRWDGRQLVPADYVSAATSVSGVGPNLSRGYGWHWWVAVEDGHRTFTARGFGGQFIHVVPDLDLVVVITSNPDTPGLDPKVLLSQTIVPAVTG